MLKSLGNRLLKVRTLLLIVLALTLSLVPLQQAWAEGETFAYEDEEKKAIIVSGGLLTSVKSPTSLKFVKEGANYKTNTEVTLQDGSTCIAAGEIAVEGENFKFGPSGENTCPFMNTLQKEGTVTETGNENSCSTAGTLSWIVCPLSDFAQNTTKLIAGIVEGLLRVEPLTLNTGDDNAIYVVWDIVRSIANIAFIIMFLIIIFSQATSLGMSNYGIKRTLPRLLVMAILVNISYYICAFSLDIANLVGAGVKGLIQIGLNAVPDPDLGGEKWDGSYGGLTVALIGGIAVLAIAGPLWGVVTAILSIVMFAALIGFVVLVTRQVLITLLIIISPLAFVAGLLPNTEQWFSRWRKTFTTLLISYPIIMFVFYGSALVAAVVGASMMPPAEGGN